MSHPLIAYLDAGTGAAIAAVVASGAVGVRAVFGSAKDKVQRKLGRASGDSSGPAPEVPAPDRA